MHAVTDLWAAFVHFEFWRAQTPQPGCVCSAGADPKYTEFLEWADGYGALPEESRY
jgi:hypothetical protein